MKKKVYSIYYIVFGSLVGINIILALLSIIFDIMIGLYGALIITVVYVLGFNISSIILSKSKLRYHGKTVTKEIEEDIVSKVFWRRCFMYAMGAQAISALAYITINYLIKGV